MLKQYPLLFGALLIGASATAQLPFEELDTDADGALSKEETAVIEDFDFDAADENGDGVLTVDEYVLPTAED